MPALSPDDVAAFLAEPGHLARIGTTDADVRKLMPSVLAFAKAITPVAAAN